ncbi:MAG TPA: hypothetical protein VKR58_07775 [Aquella sp.]|nr:hypothetical protein [Aquella sp.]
MKPQYIVRELDKILMNTKAEKNSKIKLSHCEPAHGRVFTRRGNLIVIVGLLIFLCLPISKIFAQEEVGRCYQLGINIIKDPDTYQIKSKTYHPRGNCIFAWRLQFDEEDEDALKTLNTTAGDPAKNKNIRSFLTDNKHNNGLIQARLTSAHGPFHNKNINEPEWNVIQTTILKDYSQSDPSNSRLDTLWNMSAYGLMRDNGSPYVKIQVICHSKIVENEEGVDYNKGCFTYNYSETSNMPRLGYFGIPGVSDGGPIKSRSFSSAGSTTTNTPSCKNIKVLVEGETCTEEAGKVVFHMSENTGE